MAIALRAVSAAASTSTALPAVQAGDLLVLTAHRDGNAAGPSVPTGWQGIRSSSGASVGILLAWKLWQSGDTAPTFSAATAVVIESYSGCDQSTPVGAVSTPNSDVGTGTDVGIPGLALTKTDGTGVVVAGYSHRMSGSLSTPSGMTEDVDAGHSTGGLARFGAAHTGAVSSFAARTVTATSSAAWRAAAVELIAAAGSAAPSNPGAFLPFC